MSQPLKIDLDGQCDRVLEVKIPLKTPEGNAKSQVGVGQLRVEGIEEDNEEEEIYQPYVDGPQRKYATPIINGKNAKTMNATWYSKFQFKFDPRPGECDYRKIFGKNGKSFDKDLMRTGAETKFSDYAVGVVCLALQEGLITLEDMSRYIGVWTAEGGITKYRTAQGRPFLGPNGQIISYRGTLLHGGKDWLCKKDVPILAYVKCKAEDDTRVSTVRHPNMSPPPNATSTISDPSIPWTTSTETLKPIDPEDLSMINSLRSSSAATSSAIPVDYIAPKFKEVYGKLGVNLVEPLQRHKDQNNSEAFEKRTILEIEQDELTKTTEEKRILAEARERIVKEVYAKMVTRAADVVIKLKRAADSFEDSGEEENGSYLIHECVRAFRVGIKGFEILDLELQRNRDKGDGIRPLMVLDDEYDEIYDEINNEGIKDGINEIIDNEANDGTKDEMNDQISKESQHLPSSHMGKRNISDDYARFKKSLPAFPL